MDIKKMTAGQIANITMEDFNRLSAKEAANALKKIRKSVWQRVSRLSKSDVYSPAVESLGKGLKPQKGLNRNETLAELKKGIKFLQSKTGTVSGARNVQNKIRSDLGLDKNASNAEVKDVYAAFHKLQEEFPGILTEAAGGARYAENKRKIGRMFREGQSLDEIRNEIENLYIAQSREAAETAARIESEF